MSEQILKNAIQALKTARKELANNKLLTEENREDLNKIIENADAPLTLLIMGEFSTGKSTFINAIVGKEVAAIGALPTTAVITKLCYGVEDTTTVYFRDGNSKIYDQEEFEKLTTETEDAKTKNIRENIKYVERKLPIDILQYVTFIDSPGLNGLYEVHTNTTKEFADNADAVLWMFSAGKAVSSTEMNAMEALNPRLKPFAIINQIDKLDPEEDDVEEFLADIKNKLKDKVQDVIGISALMALRGKLSNNEILVEESNFNKLKEIIETKVLPNRTQYKLNSLLDELSGWICTIELKSKNYSIEIEKLKSDNYEKYVDKKSTLLEFESNLQKITETIKGYCIAYNNLNNIPAMFMTGVLYFYGLGIDENKTKALEIAEAAAIKQHYVAQKFLINIYLKLNDYKKAFYWLKKVVVNNDAKIEYLLAELYFKGLGTEQSEKNAVKYYEMAAKHGYIEAQLKLGYYYENNANDTDDDYEYDIYCKQAVKWYKAAAEQGNAEAQYKLYTYGGLGLKGIKNKDGFIYWLKKSAKQGYVEALYELGDIYYFGRGINKDVKKGVALYEQAAEKGSVDAQLKLGQIYLNGQGAAKNDEKAVKYYIKASEQGNSEAQNMLGRCYIEGWGVTKDDSKAVEWYRKAADQGDKDAQYNLACCLLNGSGIEKDYKEAVTYYKKGAEQGDAEAQNMLGRCYIEGWGVTKDDSKAVEWYRKAADQGNKYAQFNLAICLLYGRGVIINKNNAVYWFLKAAEQNHAEAQNMLGCCYDEGWGVDKDYEKAFEWYKKAADNGNEKAANKLNGVKDNKIYAFNKLKQTAENGDVEAQYRLGRYYEIGGNVAQNYEEAFRWYKKAADNGYALAQYMVGTFIEYGRGVGKDLNIAIKWYELAAQNGCSAAENCLKVLKQADKAINISSDDAKTLYELGEKHYKKGEMGKAFEYYKKAAEKGMPEAQNSLGVCYQLALGTTENITETIKWYRKSAEQGFAKGQFNLAQCYHYGWGVDKNYNEAYKWYRKAANQGFDKAQNFIDSIINEIDSKANKSNNKTKAAVQSSGCLLPVLGLIVIMLIMGIVF